MVSHTRDASGRETTNTKLRGIPNNGADAFETEWRAQAQNNLYSGSAAGPPVGMPQWQQQQQQQGTRSALPTSGTGSAGQAAMARSRSRGDQ